MSRRLILLAATLGLLAACSDSTGPDLSVGTGSNPPATVSSPTHPTTTALPKPPSKK
jgi:hypothetical protein